MRRVLVVAFSAALLCALSVIPADATPYGRHPGGPGYWPDSTDHWYCYDPGGNVPAGDYPIYQNALQYLDSTTSMYDVYTGTCGTATDVRISNVHPIPGCGGCLGMAPCIAWTGYLNLACDQAMEYVDATNIFLTNDGWNGDPSVYNFNLMYNARHELGHTAGMGHSGNTLILNHVMAQGFYTDHWNWSRWSFRSEDTCHVNNLFGGPACNH
jgi:hypothetical protein